MDMGGRQMKLLDCTLRDGGNVVGKGYNIEYTVMMIKGLIRANIKTIEMGNCVGIGAWKSTGDGCEGEYAEGVIGVIDFL